jgi:hypothetical protein
LPAHRTRKLTEADAAFHADWYFDTCVIGKHR